MKIAVETLRADVVRILRKNCSQLEAEEIADYIVWAEMSGNNTQGILKLIGTEPLQDIHRSYDPKIIKDTKLSQIIDAGASPAPLATLRATEAGIHKAKAHGIGMVGVRNTFSSNGAQAYYVEKIAEEGLIGLMVSRSPAAATAFGSIDPLFGTNPIGFAFPTLDEPIVFDTATSAMTFYGLILAKAQGTTIPEGMAIDKDGAPTTDPAEAMNGALLSFDKSYKGSGLALLVELLAGPLIGGAFIDNDSFKEEWGTFILAIDPELFVEAREFKASTTQLLERIKSSRAAAGHDIRIPGEASALQRKMSAAEGIIEIDQTLYDKIFS